MITDISLHNFKAFRALDLPLASLTVLTGFNSTGKSTVIQAVLLAQVASQSSQAVPLNGPFGLALGEAKDVLNSEAGEEDVITIRLRSRAGSETVRLSVPGDRSVALVRGANVSDETRRSEERRDGHIDAYLSAERLGPRDLLEISPDGGERMSVGERGQYTAHVLAALDRNRITGALLHPNTDTESLASTLAAQAEAWLSSIASPVRIQATWLEHAGAAMLRFRHPDLASEWSRPANVGFGLSYALPIIVAGLTCRSGTLLLVENPEAHLHPAGQSAIGHFLARVASTGVQVIVETHSDHVLNGIRLAIAVDGLVPAAEALIYFFQGGKPPDQIVPQRGGLSAWPAGFFDQAEVDLIRLSRVQARG